MFYTANKMSRKMFNPKNGSSFINAEAQRRKVRRE